MGGIFGGFNEHDFSGNQKNNRKIKKQDFKILNKILLVEILLTVVFMVVVFFS